MSALTNQHINGYEFREQVGAGGFGVVFRAFQTAIGREVAIKVILPEHASQPSFRRRFEQEARLIARLEHPHIVPLYDYWQDEQGAFLVMRWLPKTLRSVLSDHALSLEDAARLLDQIASALQVAHQQGVIHRDIKPDNILLDSTDNAYLADFGIAKSLETPTITQDGQFVGSLAYVSPEQINQSDASPQTDIYSLGLVVYEVLTGGRPYEGVSASALIRHQLNEPLPSLRDRNPHLPAALDAVLAMATAKKPTERYPSAVRFAQAFRAALPSPRSLQPLPEALTERELEILKLMAEGLTNGGIAERLFLTAETVKWYKKQIYSKLNAHSKETALAQAQALNLIEPEAGSERSAVRVEQASITVASVIAPVPALRLPVQTTPFFGRDAEITALISLIRDEQTRLITLLAPGGMGKTRLALEVASRLGGDFTHGVSFVSLAQVASPENVVAAIAQTVGVVLAGQIDPAQQLLSHFRDQSALLVLDNFEHLLDAADLVNQILQEAPGVKILTTSRERLNLSAEMIFPLGGMDVPDETAEEAALLTSSAVRLFVGVARRTRASTPYTEGDLRQIGRICHLVGGMPLAILLAASWVEYLKVSDIADEVASGMDALESQWRDVPERQRSIRAVFEATWARLTEKERAVMMKLSVFRGGFTRRAAEQVAGASLRLLSVLVNKALLVMDAEGRCTIHELLRQYAAEQLADAGLADEIGAAHSAYYLQAVADREADLVGHNQLVALNDIAIDLDNLRAAVEWATNQEDFTRLSGAIHPLWLFFYMRSRYAEGSALLGMLDDHLHTVTPSPARDALLADVLSHQAHLNIYMFERHRADRMLVEAESLIDAVTQPRLSAFRQLVLATTMPWEDGLATLVPAREALLLYRSLKDQWGMAYALHRLGTAWLFSFSAETNREQITEYLQEAVGLCEAIGDGFLSASLQTAFTLYLPVDDPSRIERLQRIVDLRRAFGAPILIANALINLGMAYAYHGDLGRALLTFQEAVEIKRSQGNRRETVGFDDLGETYLRLGRLPDARAVFEEAFERVHDSEQAAWRNIYRVYLIHVDVAAGNYQEAEKRADELYRENESAADFASRHQMTLALTLAGWAALARQDPQMARMWQVRADDYAQGDATPNGAIFAQLLAGRIALSEQQFQNAADILSSAIRAFHGDYEPDASQGWDFYFGLMLALTGAGRAYLTLGDNNNAASCCQEALKEAQQRAIAPFALMGVSLAAEIAASAGVPNHADSLAWFVVHHPQTFAADRADAQALLDRLEHLDERNSATLEGQSLWEVVVDLLAD